MTTNNHDTTQKILQIITLDLIEYNKADMIQRNLQSQRQQEIMPDTILLLEHPYVITLGTRGTQADILAQSSILQKNKVQIIQTDRGGQNTIHGPGQLVGYLLIHLYRKRQALRQFVYDLEQALIDTMIAFGIHAYRHSKHVGIWTNNGKIAAIGIAVNHGVTRHGFALNVSSHLEMFSWIVPCGIIDGKVTSMQQELQQEISMQAVMQKFTEIFSKQKQYSTVIQKDSSFLEEIGILQ